MITFCIKFSGHLPYMKASHLIMFTTKSLILRGPGSYLIGQAKPARSKVLPAAKRLRGVGALRRYGMISGHLPYMKASHLIMPL